MSFLKRWFSGGDPPPHPVFGRIRLVKSKLGSYWEAEPGLDGEEFSVSIETRGAEPPSDEQVRFYERIVRDLDAAFARAAPLLVPEYERWTRSAFPPTWRSAFQPTGMSVPLDGLDTNPWDLSFDCLTDEAGHMFTCSFEGGRPSYVRIDG